jgi:hypothetical protein
MNRAPFDDDSLRFSLLGNRPCREICHHCEENCTIEEVEILPTEQNQKLLNVREPPMTVLTPTFDIPSEIKDEVADRLKRKGALRAISREVKVAMTAAISELRGLHPDAKSVLEFHALEGAGASELAALQAIYAYLEEVGLTYTLGCLAEETGIDKTIAKYNLVEIAQEFPSPPPDSPKPTSRSAHK